MGNLPTLNRCLGGFRYLPRSLSVVLLALWLAAVCSALNTEAQEKKAVASIGASPDDVIGALGQPYKIAKFGPQTIYFYRDRKITFQDGKVSSVAQLDEKNTSESDGLQAKVVEPELVGHPYLQDEAGKLVPLEQISWQLKGFAKHMEVEGARSPVRVTKGSKMLFVVRIVKGTPAMVALLALETTEQGNRKTEAIKGHPNAAIHLHSTKFGESSYGVTPDSDLAPGEYAFHFRDSKVLYCFGVD